MYDLRCLLCNPIALNLVKKAVEFTCTCPRPDLIGLTLTTVISIVFPITVFTIFTILATFDAALFTIFPTLLQIYLPSCFTICTVYTILFVTFATRANMSGVPRTSVCFAMISNSLMNVMGMIFSQNTQTIDIFLWVIPSLFQC